MITDTEIKVAGIRELVNALGAVQAEKFIALIQREPFDYTEWQQTLWANKSLEEISESAMRSTQPESS
jgi:hypothetical protein